MKIILVDPRKDVPPDHIFLVDEASIILYKRPKPTMDGIVRINKGRLIIAGNIYERRSINHNA